jgi:hypothetical protein
MHSRTEDSALADAGMSEVARPLPAEGLQLHLGSGPYAQPGWIGVDKSLVATVSRVRPLVWLLAKAGILTEQQRATRWPKEIVRMDLTKRFIWDDDSVRAIYSSHMFEHLSRDEARQVLEGCRRVLAPGGVLRIVLPNLNGAVRHYLEAKEAGDSTAADGLVEFLYFVPEHGEASWLQRAALRLVHRPHRWMYDAESLLEMLLGLGYSPAVRRVFREGSCPDLELLETRCDDLFVDDSFYVEAFKS